MSDQTPIFEARGLRVAIEGKEILRGVDLTIERGQVHALMGRNGSGKSTLAYVAMGHPHYEVLEGEIFYDGQDITEMDTDERARRGMFLAFQYPMAISGVTVSKFMHSALKARAEGGNVQLREFRDKLSSAMDLLGVDKSFTGRYVNDGFSGGEKKRLEILQMFMLEPSFAILDETDSGLDIDALKTVAEGVNATRSDERSHLIITHYQRLLNYIVPDVVHVMMDGQIVRAGGPELAVQLEENGYEWLEDELLQPASV
jgi:Fe-S cluster assembly ATP-binding protein